MRQFLSKKPTLTWFAQKTPWLRYAYVLPQLLDPALLAHTLVRHPAKARAMRTLEHEVLRWPGVSASIHRCGGTEFRSGRREMRTPARSWPAGHALYAGHS